MMVCRMTCIDITIQRTIIMAKAVLSPPSPENKDNSPLSCNYKYIYLYQVIHYFRQKNVNILNL